MNKSKPLIESKDSKMKSSNKRIKPKKINIFKRMKKSTTKFFGKNTSYDILNYEDFEIYKCKNHDLETKSYLPWLYLEL